MSGLIGTKLCPAETLPAGERPLPIDANNARTPAKSAHRATSLL
jgi:hypothetical protein